MESLIPAFYDCTLHQRQQYYHNGHFCFYCKNPTELVDSKEVYQESHGLLFLCRKCKAWVGTHNGNTDHSFGFTAKRDLRDLRHLCHQKFDPLWQLKVAAGAKKKTAQADARRWLAGKLGIDVIECHIGMMDNERCKQVLALCEEVYKDLEVKKIQRDHNTKWIVDAVYFLQQDLDEIFTVREDKMNNFHLLTLKHKVTDFVLKIKPREKTYSISIKDKWKPFDSVETLIYSYFKPK